MTSMSHDPAAAVIGAQTIEIGTLDCLVSHLPFIHAHANRFHHALVS